MALPNLGRTPLPKPGKIRYGVSPTGPGAPAGFDRTCRAGFVVVASERTAMAFQRLAPPDPGPLTQPGGRALRIALLCPRGPLYRHRGGIWKKTMRYAPLTLTTLASLIPPEINAEVSLLDEGVDEIDPGAICADLVGYKGPALRKKRGRGRRQRRRRLDGRCIGEGAFRCQHGF